LKTGNPNFAINVGSPNLRSTRILDPEEGPAEIKELDKKYGRK